MKLSPIVTGILCFGVFIMAPPYFAQSAEIININYKYKIAFADLTESDVKAGDVVMVTTPDGMKAQLKVVETYPVMVKLTVADEAGAHTDEQFAAIPVGSQVIVAGRASTAVRTMRSSAKVAKASVGAAEDAPGHVERYAPGAQTGDSGKESIDEIGRIDKPVANVSASTGTRSTSTAATEITSASSTYPSALSDTRCAVMDQRLDQMMTNNVKLAENITQILSEKNAAEAKARDKEAEAVAARVKATELASVNATLMARIKTLEVAVAAVEQDKMVKQREIESLNLKLGELKKKLAKMVEIVNTNMKAYEK